MQTLKEIDDFSINTILGGLRSIQKNGIDMEDTNHVCSLLEMHVKTYLNICWTKYNDSSDDYITDYIETVQDKGLLTHPGCILHRTRGICINFIKCICHSNINLKRPIEEMTKMVDVCLTKTCEKTRESLSQLLPKCDSECEKYVIQ